MSIKKILIVEDDSTFCLMLQSFLSKNNFEVVTTTTVVQALQILNKEFFDLILTDYRLPDKDGIELLQEIIKRKSNIPIIVMTSYGDIRLAVKAIKNGAYDYITKPINPSELLELVKNTLSFPGAKTEGRDNSTTNHASQFIEGLSESWKKLQEQINLVAPTFLSVILQGESGTGKEFVARKLHQLSKRSDKPFIALDCGTLSTEIANSELFGHVKGAFTGAVSDKQGQFELANGGTIFLDEIGNLSYEIQVKLLRAIQERKIRKTGGTKDIATDLRIIVATNENLQNAVMNGTFREDLYHRLNEFRITLDPLRNRKEDIPLFLTHFLQQSNKELGKNITGFDKDVIEKLLAYSWPGNLRELKNCIRKAVLMAKGNKINIDCLPSEILNTSFVFNDADKTTTSNLKILSEKLEKETILKALHEARYNKSKAAKLLNIDRKTLYNKMRDYKIDL